MSRRTKATSAVLGTFGPYAEALEKYRIASQAESAAKQDACKRIASLREEMLDAVKDQQLLSWLEENEVLSALFFFGTTGILHVYSGEFYWDDRDLWEQRCSRPFGSLSLLKRRLKKLERVWGGIITTTANQKKMELLVEKIDGESEYRLCPVISIGIKFKKP